ncbi:MAG: hypothetical protein P4L67_04440 [Candidatus Pacebacteria bacterium]|nr:hypothetical protein [Candidatus Paceibacterota bacterium]
MNIANCQYVIDALNKTPGTETNVNERHPVPWHIESVKECGCRYVVTTAGLGENDLEYCVSCVGQIRKEYVELFVEAVNGFYKEMRS